MTTAFSLVIETVWIKIIYMDQEMKKIDIEQAKRKLNMCLGLLITFLTPMMVDGLNLYFRKKT